MAEDSEKCNSNSSGRHQIQVTVLFQIIFAVVHWEAECNTKCTDVCA